jgi:hypothetical protein
MCDLAAGLEGPQFLKNSHVPLRERTKEDRRNVAVEHAYIWPQPCDQEWSIYMPW